jgi:hypothetical protein
MTFGSPPGASPILAAMIALLAIIGGAQLALAQQLDLEEEARRPGFTVTKKIVNGEEIVEIRKATVVIEMSSKGTLGMDSDTAVLCAWDSYISAKLGADFCFPDSEPELREDLADALERFKDFIVANSISPVQRDELDVYAQRKFARTFAKPPSPPNAERCQNYLGEFKARGREKRREDVAKILAVPRPPVLAPCI